MVPIAEILDSVELETLLEESQKQLNLILSGLLRGGCSTWRVSKFQEPNITSSQYFAGIYSLIYSDIFFNLFEDFNT